MGLLFRNLFLTKNSIQIKEHKGEPYLELTLPAFKTDPFRFGIQLTILSSNDYACPVNAWKVLAQIDRHRPQFAPLFYIGQLEQRPFKFTREYVVQNLREFAIHLGLVLGMGIAFAEVLQLGQPM